MATMIDTSRDPAGGRRGKHSWAQTAQENQMKKRDARQRSRQLSRQGHGRLIRGSSKDPLQQADEDLDGLRQSAIDALLECYWSRSRRIASAAVDEVDLAALRKVYAIRRWEDPETGERSRDWWELAPRGKWAAQRAEARGRAAVEAASPAQAQGSLL